MQEQTDTISTGIAAPLPPYLEGVNPAQREAIETLEGPLLVLAGAGTGKTRVLTARLAHILSTRSAWPSEILAVTFTNKAAREMKERVAGLIGEAVEGIWLGTFHAIAVRLLRRHGECVGLERNFTILDTDDQLRLLKQLLEAENIDPKRCPPRLLAAAIDRWKNAAKTPEKLSAAEAQSVAEGRGKDLYAAYQARLKALNACDFGDLLLHCVTIFTEHADILAEYQRRFRYILVDEYQDTNVVQYLWLRLLAREHGNICCVGDDDQSIYGWRGAEVGNILRFEKDFPGARIIRLEQNYRSTAHILAAADGIIAHNDGRLGKTLWTDTGEGEKVAVHGVWDGDEEARLVGELIEQRQRAGCPLNEMAILVRAGFQTRAFEERLLVIGLPYRMIGGRKFYERAEIRDATAYLRVIVQPADDLAFERIVNTPKRGLGDATLRLVHHLARKGGIPLTAAARNLVETDELRPRARSSLRKLLDDFDRWRRLAGELPHTELAEMVLDESGYTAMWQADRSPEAAGRLENLKELIRAMEGFENLQGFMEHVALATEGEDGDDEDRISIMTLHGAKGLEFDTVFLPGWEEGLFPHQRALDETGNAGLEEERRLAYVGITRARRHCHILFAANRRIYNQWQASIPSRFIDELPPEHIELQRRGGMNAGFHGGGSTAAPWRSSVSASRQEEKGGEGEYKAGMRVFHQKFGYGLIRQRDGNRLDIDFDKAGRKKVIDSFVEPA